MLLDDLEVTGPRRKQFEGEFRDTYRTHLQRYVTTLRRAKRYINGIRAGLPAVKGDVNLHDYCVLEILRLCSEHVYEDIWQHRWIYLPSWGSEGMWEWPLDVRLDETKRKKATRGHIEELLAGEPEAEFLRSLLRKLFFTIEESFNERAIGHGGEEECRREKRLTHPTCFDTYFCGRVGESEVPDSEVERVIRGWNEADADEVFALVEESIEDYRAREKLVPFLERVQLFRSEVAPVRVGVVVRVLWKKVPAFKKDSPWESEYERARSLLLYLANDQAPDEEVAELVRGCIRECSSLHFVTVATYHIVSRSEGRVARILAHISREEVRSLAADRMRHELLVVGGDVFAKYSRSEAGTILINGRRIGVADDGSGRKPCSGMLRGWSSRHLGELLTCWSYSLRRGFLQGTQSSSLRIS